MHLSRWWLGFSLLFVALMPGVSEAGNLGPFAEIGALFLAVLSLAYLGAAVFIAWLVVKAISSFMQTREFGGGMGEFLSYAALAVGSAIIAFVIVPGFIAPGLALGATLP